MTTLLRTARPSVSLSCVLQFLVSLILLEEPFACIECSGRVKLGHLSGPELALHAARVQEGASLLSTRADAVALLSLLLLGRLSYASPLAISPPSATVAPKQSVAFSASGGSDSGYVWAFVTNASDGMLTPTGSYTAGTIGDVSDTIQVEDSLGQVDSATVTVTSALSIMPPHMDVYPSQNVVFFADGGSGTGYVWTYIANNSGGILYPTGQFTAGTAYPSEDTIGVTDSLGATATATITLYELLRLQPGLPTVQPRQTLLFTASGGSGQYLWAFSQNNSGGTLSQSGLYTAGSTGDTSDKIVVTDATLGWDTGDIITVTTASCSGLGAAFLPLSLLPLLLSRRPRKPGDD